jgi:hypothetical protein
VRLPQYPPLPAGAVCLLLALSLAAAQPADTIDHLNIYVAGTAGGGIDLYARLLGRHIGRHIPGRPTVTVQAMPGAGGIRAANFLAQQAPRDGTAIAAFAGGPLLEPLIRTRNPGYDMSQFTSVGALTQDVGLCVAWAKSPFKTIDDVKKQQMVVAGTGAGSDTDIWPLVLNDVLGTKFKLVTGYLGTQETFLAIERGEAHGRCVISRSALKIAKPDWLRDKKINVLAITALTADRNSRMCLPSWISSPGRKIVNCSNFLPDLPPSRVHLLVRLDLFRSRLSSCAAPSMRRSRIPGFAPMRQKFRQNLRRPRVSGCKRWSDAFMRRRLW